MSGTIALEHPKVREVERDIFLVTFAPDCMTHECRCEDEGSRVQPDACCQHGCDVDLFERDATVATCNLKSDTSGDVRPGAKAVDAQAALAIPVRGPGGALRAVVGIAFLGERDFSDDELLHFERLAADLPSALPNDL